MNAKLTAAALLGSLIATGAQAATISFSASIPFSDTNWNTAPPPFNPPTGGGSLVLGLFDDLGGTRVLTGVTITAQALARGTTTISNTGTTDLVYGTPNDSVSGSIQISSTVGGVAISLNPIATENIGNGFIATGDSPIVVDVGGGIAGPGASDSDSVSYSSPGDLAAFIGTGTFTLDALALGTQTVSLSGQGAVTIDLEAAANAEIVYTFDEPTEPPTEVPAPGVLILLGTGLVGIAAARRRRAA